MVTASLSVSLDVLVPPEALSNRDDTDSSVDAIPTPVSSRCQEEAVGSSDEANSSSSSDDVSVGLKFSSWKKVREAVDDLQRKKFCQFYVRDSRTLNQARKFSPKLVNKVPESLKYTFIHFACIHGGRTFKSRPKDGSRPQQM